jgi:hypothetical protein
MGQASNNPAVWAGYEALEGYELAWKVVRPDGRTRGDFRWPFKGAVKVPKSKVLPHRGACPEQGGDGLCLAKTWAGAASGGLPAITGLVVAYKVTDILGEDGNKIRVRACRVLGPIDLHRLVRDGCGSGANLSRANLCGANLCEANLCGTNLCGANLYGANLCEANLCGTNLCGANLCGANLSGANLSRANLSTANLSRANLSTANLSRANLYAANLSRANLYGADLSTAHLYAANLSRADLSTADLSTADLSGALNVPAGVHNG